MRRLGTRHKLRACREPHLLGNDGANRTRRGAGIDAATSESFRGSKPGEFSFLFYSGGGAAASAPGGGPICRGGASPCNDSPPRGIAPAVGIEKYGSRVIRRCRGFGPDDRNLCGGRGPPR